jgi:hypothetical protein
MILAREGGVMDGVVDDGGSGGVSGRHIGDPSQKEDEAGRGS